MESIDEVCIHDTSAWRFYLLLALFDTRDGSYIGRLVQTAREGFERENHEDDAWAEFDALWGRLTPSERLHAASEAPDER